MAVRFYMLGVVCMLFVLIQSAATQEEETSEERCPKLAKKVARVACVDHDDAPTSCKGAKPGTKAQVFWKSITVGNTKNGAVGIVCQPPGVWKKGGGAPMPEEGSANKQ